MSASKLTFSIIVNTVDRAASLETLLRALEHQSYPHFEVIVVVGPTQDNTLEVLEPWKERVRIVRCPTANLSQSRNIGLLAAGGDIVAYIDDDAVPSNRWLEQLAHVFTDPEVTAAGGVVYAVHPNLTLHQFQKGFFSTLSEQVDVRPSLVSPLRGPGYATFWFNRLMGTNMAFRRNALLDIGGFDEFYNYIAEEADVLFRLLLQGGTVLPLKEATVYHVPASSRNRQVFTNKGRWWIRTRSRLYFGIKNGLAAGEPRRLIILRSLRTWGANLYLYYQWLRHGELHLKDAVRMGIKEIIAGAEGIRAAVFRPRKLLSPSQISQARQRPPAWLPFQPDPSHKPAVDPLTGRTGHLTMPDSPLRICLLSGTYPPSHYDGVARLTHLMAQGLFELGHQVHVITRGEQESVQFYDGAYVHRIPLALERYTSYRSMHNLYCTLNHAYNVYRKVRQLILNDGIQIVDSPLWQYEGLTVLHSGLLPVVVRIVTGIRQIMDIHQSEVSEFALMGDLEEELLQKAHHVLPNTRHTLDSVRQFYTFDTSPARCTIVPYGLVPAPDEQVPAFQEQKQELTVLYVGRLEKRKGIQVLFDAIPRVLRQVPHARFIIAGRDNSHSDGFQMEHGMDYPTYFQTHYPAAVQAQVEFKGQVSEETLQSLYQQCDVFVAPSLYESFGLVYLEAMNYGKPVIGCQTGGIPEVVEDGVTGLLVEPGAAEPLANALIRLLTTPALRREMGEAGRHQVLTRFSYLTMARRYAEVYRQVIAQYGENHDHA